MGYSTSHSVNEGLHIVGDQVSIDVIVRKIGGSKRWREADFEIRGVTNLETLHLSHSDGIVPLIEGVEIRVRDNV